MASNGRLNRLYSRYYCPTNEAHRVYPYDTFEAATEAPSAGVKGNPILLFSSNGNVKPDAQGKIHKTAWCWACNSWVQAYRKTTHEIMSMYLSRQGVTFRIKANNEKRKVAELEAKVEARRSPVRA